jgi:hypothetical protein
MRTARGWSTLAPSDHRSLVLMRADSRALSQFIALGLEGVQLLCAVLGERGEDVDSLMVVASMREVWAISSAVRARS